MKKIPKTAQIKPMSEYRADFENWVKKQCNKLTKRQQIVIVLIMMFVFICLSFMMFTVSLYNIGVNNGKKNAEEQITNILRYENRE